MSGIPVARLRWMKAKLSAMVADFEHYYPGMMTAITDGRSDSQSETIRNIATAEAEIDGWITARIAGRRRDLHHAPTSAAALMAMERGDDLQPLPWRRLSDLCLAAGMVALPEMRGTRGNPSVRSGHPFRPHDE